MPLSTSTPRFFITSGDLCAGAEIELPTTVVRHAVQVLRLRSGAPMVLFDGCGGEYHAELGDTGRDGKSKGKTKSKIVTAKVIAFSPREAEAPLTVNLGQALTKGERMDFILQKATELGVAALTPLISERSTSQPSGERLDKRLQHWRGVLSAACEQCGRNRLPQLAEPTPLADWLAALDTSTNAAPSQRLVLDPDAEHGHGHGHGLSQLPAPNGPVILLVGPEGGLSNTEITLAERHHFYRVRLGPRVLRAETAGIAALAALQTLWGDFCTY